MNSFSECSKIEQVSLQRLHPWFESMSGGRYAITPKGRLARLLQEQIGDVILNDRKGRVLTFECKAEQENKYERFFIESWSNKKLFNLGWFLKVDADILLYHFLKGDEIYAMRLRELRQWCFEHDIDGHCRLHNYKEYRQKKYDQLNDTWGYCVDIVDVLAGVQSAKRIYLPDAVAAA